MKFGGTLLNPDCSFSKVSIDSRKFADGDLFIALCGDRFDGHEFLGEIVTKAAGLVLIIQIKVYPYLSGWWKIPRTLGQLALMNRNGFDGQLIAITGSSGKTSVKEMVAAIHSQNAVVHATKGNLNNHIGVPLTLLSMDASAEIAVIEMGASGGGEIAYLCDIAKPDIALVNNIQHAHIEGFGSIEVAPAKSEIYSGLKANGTAVINLDLSWSKDWIKSLNNAYHLFNRAKRCNIYADNIKTLDSGCSEFELCANGERASLILPIPGLHSVKNAVAAAACALVGHKITANRQGLNIVKPVTGRLNTCQLSNKVTLIDDTYNANPDSFKAAIDVLSATKGNKVLVMGDMAELGERAMEMHEEIGAYAKKKGLDVMHSVGLLALLLQINLAEHTMIANRILSMRSLISVRKQQIQLF